MLNANRLAVNNSFFLLTPFTPLARSAARQLSELSDHQVVDDTPMISILSPKMEKNASLGLQALSMLNIRWIYLYFAFWVLINAIMMVTMLTSYRRDNSFIKMVALLLHQPIPKKMFFSNKSSNFLANFMVLSLFIHIFISNTFLEMVKFKSFSFVESLDELSLYPKLEVFMFNNEITKIFFEQIHGNQVPSPFYK